MVFKGDDCSSVESSEQGTTAMTAETITPPQSVWTTSSNMESLEFEASAPPPPTNPKFFGTTSDDGEESELFIEKSDEKSRIVDKNVAVAAGIATGIVGLLFYGVLGGLVAGGAVAYATTRPGAAGDVARVDKNVAVAAGIATGIVGLLFYGVFGGLVAGGAVAYATTRPGAAGDVARAVGDVALVASEKTKELNEKHKIVDKSKKAMAGAAQKVVELEREHRVFDRTMSAFMGSFRGSLAFVVKKIAGKDNDDLSSDSSGNDEKFDQQTQTAENKAETKKLHPATLH